MVKMYAGKWLKPFHPPIAHYNNALKLIVITLYVQQNRFNGFIIFRRVVKMYAAQWLKPFHPPNARYNNELKLIVITLHVQQNRFNGFASNNLFNFQA